MNFDLSPAHRRDNLPTNPDIRFGRLVDTYLGRGAVSRIDWEKDLVYIQMLGAPVEERHLTHGAYGMKQTKVLARVETVFPYDEVTPVPVVNRTAVELEQFLVAHSSGKPAKKRATARKTALPRPILYDSGELAIGETVIIPELTTPQLFIAKGPDSKLIVVQDTVTGTVGFAEKKTSRRTGQNFLQPALV